MGWRTDFKKDLKDEFENIQDIGDVKTSWEAQPDQYPALTILLADEDPMRTMGSSEGVMEVNFKILGRNSDVDEPDETREDLLNEVYKKIEGITGYVIIVERTVFHEGVGEDWRGFELTGKATVDKDFASM